MDEYWKCVAESDAAWNAYQKHTSDLTWENYVEAKQAEYQAFSKLTPQEQEKIVKEG